MAELISSPRLRKRRAHRCPTPAESFDRDKLFDAGGARNPSDIARRLIT
jgi:hypothetical protein